MSQVNQLTEERNRLELEKELLAFQNRKLRERVIRQRLELRRLNRLREPVEGAPMFLVRQAF